MNSPEVLIFSPNRVIICVYPHSCYCLDAVTQKVVWTLEERYESKALDIFKIPEKPDRFKVYFCTGIVHEVSVETGRLLDDGILVK